MAPPDAGAGRSQHASVAVQSIRMKLTIAAVTLLWGTLTFADGGKEALPKPCQTIATACEAAGFHSGGHKEGKGLWKDCVAPILDGRTIPGVTVSSDDVKSCQAKRPRDRG
jgi:hypothetical protein